MSEKSVRLVMGSNCGAQLGSLFSFIVLLVESRWTSRVYLKLTLSLDDVIIFSYRLVLDGITW